MTTGATGQLGLALPVQGELSGTWGNTVNNAITEYTNIAIAATLTLTNDGAVTLANTTGTDLASNIVSSLTGAGTVTAQFAIVRVTGTLTTAKVVTAPSYSKTYTVVNAATGGIVTFKASGQTGVSIAVGESAFVYYNGTDYVKVSSTVATGVTSFTAGTTGLTPNTATTGAVTLAGTLATTNGGTGLTSFTSGGVVYASSSSALATGSALTFDGSNLSTTGQVLLENNKYIGFKNTTGTYAASIFNDTSNFLNFYNSGNTGTIFYVNAAEQMRLTSTGLGIGTTSPAAKLDVLGSFFNGGSSRTNSTTKTFGFRVPHFLTATDPMNIIGGLSTTSVNNVYIGGSDSNIGGTAATDLFFYTAANNTTANGTLRMTITSAGDVGIGTSSPDVFANGFAKNLGVAVTGSGATASINVSGGSGGAGRIQFGTEANRYGLIYVDASNYMQIGTTTSLPISVITNNTEKARISAAGGFSVGTTSDPGAGAIYATGNITAYYSSDIKFKENVRNIPDALATVNAIGGKLFDWTDDYIESKGGADGYFVQKADFGVVAQDVQKVFPIAVRTREDGSLAVDYEKLGALAFAALVELTKRVEALEAK